MGAGTNEHLKEVGSTKNPRDGLTTVEEDFYAKKQRTTGAFGEASSVRLGLCSYLYMVDP